MLERSGCFGVRDFNNIGGWFGNGTDIVQGEWRVFWREATFLFFEDNARLATEGSRWCSERRIGFSGCESVN